MAGLPDPATVSHAIRSSIPTDPAIGGYMRTVSAALNLYRVLEGRSPAGEPSIPASRQSLIYAIVLR
jgi:hypothetical protein